MARPPPGRGLQPPPPLRPPRSQTFPCRGENRFGFGNSALSPWARARSLVLQAGKKGEGFTVFFFKKEKRVALYNFNSVSQSVVVSV